MPEKPNNPPFEPFVDATKIAAFLSIPKREVLDLTRRGLLPAYPVDPSTERKTWRYRLSEVVAVMEKRRGR